MHARTPDASWLPFFLVLIPFVLVRIAALVHFQSDLQTDPDIYLTLARSLSAGEGMIDPGSGLPTAFRPPLYPLLLVPFCGPDQVFARGLLHLILSVVTLLALWGMGKNLQLPVSRIVLAALIFTVDPLAVRYLALPMTETLCTCLMTLLLYLMTRNHHSRADLFLIGLVFGLAVLSRPTFWAFGLIAGPLLLLQAYLSKRNEPVEDRRRELSLSSTCVLTGIGLIVLPWLIRNVLVMHAPILMTTHGGYTLFLGNNSAFYREVVQQPLGTIWDGSHGPGQQAWLDSITRAAQQAELSGEVELDRWMSAEAKREIVSHPTLFLRACLLKFCWFWNLGPQGPEAAGIPGWLRMGIRLFYGSFWCAAIWGAIQLLQLGSGKATDPRTTAQVQATVQSSVRSLTILWRWRLILIFIGSLMLPHLVYWSDTRMRAPITPALALLAASILPLRRPDAMKKDLRARSAAV